MSHIFQKLARFGRLSIGQVAQRCRLLQRQAKAGVGTLVQLRLVQHNSIDGFSTYQVNLSATYNLLRIGKLTELAHQSHGDIASSIIEILAANGFTTVKQLEVAFAEVPHRVNGTHNGQNGNSRSSKFQTTLGALVNGGFIGRVRPAHLHIPHDARQAAESSHKEVGAGGKKGEAERAQRAAQVAADLERRLDTFVSDDALDRAFNLLDSGEEEIPEDELFLCPNYSLVITTFRDTTVIQDVTRTLGKPSSRLARSVLKQIPLQEFPYDPDPNPREDIHTLAMTRLTEDLESELHNGINGHRDVAMTNGVDEGEFADREDLEDGLRVLSEGPYPFLQCNENTNQWVVNKYSMSSWLRERELLRLMASTVSSIGLRLIRMMIDKGKLDEKLLQEVGLLAAKGMRQALAELQSKGYIELQEVPREPQRQPSRTMYLWFYDSIRARDLLLGELYKTMARLYQRLQMVERERMKATLEKTERDDVRGRALEDVLAEQELVQLQQFQAKEKWLMAEIARLDESVVLLRDL